MAYTRISPDELDRDCLTSCERRPCTHVDQLVPEVMTDTRTVEGDTSLCQTTKQSLVSVAFCLREPKAKRTRNDIARDVRSGRAGSDEGTAPAVALSAR